jgi:hypothetical protein
LDRHCFADVTRWKQGLIHCGVIPSPREGEGILRLPKEGGLIRVVVVAVMIWVVGVMIIAMVVGHRVADGRATNSAHDGADWTAHHRPADRASNPSGYRSRLVG